MNVLQVYTPGDSMAKSYSAMLTENLGQHVYMRTATNRNDFKKLYTELKPDIIHLHGLPPFSLPTDIRLVVTPHGQTIGALNAYIFVARSQMEYSQLTAVTDRRVVTVRNPLITRTISPEECAGNMMRIYSRIMNSNVLQLMDTPVRRAMKLILSAAVYGDLRWLKLDDSDMSVINSLKPIDFQRIYIYSSNEGMLQQAEKGLALLGINAPAFQPVECYLPHSYKKPEPLNSTNIIDIISDIRTKGPSLLRLSELISALHKDNLDEGQLTRQLEERSMMPLFSSALQLASEKLFLTEGFMPCPPSDNRETQQLRIKLEKRQDVMA